MYQVHNDSWCFGATNTHTQDSMYSPVNDTTVLIFEILRGFFFKLKGSLTKQSKFYAQISVRPLTQCREILAVLIICISSDLKICIYMTDLDFQTHCQL